MCGYHFASQILPECEPELDAQGLMGDLDQEDAFRGDNLFDWTVRDHAETSIDWRSAAWVLSRGLAGGRH